jgi:hypothetical protein
MGKPYDTTPWVATYCMEAHAFEEVGSLSTSCVATSESNRVVLEANSCSNRSRQLHVGSSNHAQRHKHGDCGLSCQEGPGTRMHEPTRPKDTISQTPRSHPRGFTGPTRISRWHGPAQGYLRDRPTLGMTTQNGGEATSSACGPKIVATPSRAGAQGLAAPQQWQSIPQ